MKSYTCGDYIRSSGNSPDSYKIRLKWIREKKDFMIRYSNKSRKQIDETKINFGMP